MVFVRMRVVWIFRSIRFVSPYVRASLPDVRARNGASPELNGSLSHTRRDRPLRAWMVFPLLALERV